MMRGAPLLAALLVGATVASAQMPPSISKPIEQAKKAAAATNAQTAAVNQAPAAAPSTPAAAKPATKPASAPQAKPAAAPAKQAVAAKAAPAPAKAAPADSTKVTFQREVFAYVRAGRRDPFASPIETGEIRPLVADLKVVGIIFDPAGRNSVAVMRDMATQQQYRAKSGQLLGRARVVQIKPQEVVLSIEEYGFSRQETLKLNTQQTQQTKGKP